MSAYLLMYYEAIEDLSLRMLAAARQGDWTEVNRIELDCKTFIAQLEDRKKANPLSRAEQVEKLRIMRRIVTIDAEIRNLAQPWLSAVTGMYAGTAPDSRWSSQRFA